MKTYTRNLSIALSSSLIFALSFSSVLPATGAPLTGADTAAPYAPGAPSIVAGQNAEASVSHASTVEETTDQLVVKFKEGTDQSAKTSILDDAAEQTALDNQSTEIVSQTVKDAEIVKSDQELSPTEQKEVVEKLSSSPEVEYAEADLRIISADAAYSTVTPNDPLWNLQWNMKAINALDAWNLNAGEGVVIGIADEGYSTHPELNSKTLPGYDFTSREFSRDGDGWDSNPQDQGDWSNSKNSMWHGMHVAGIAAASSNNRLGLAGVAPRAKVQHARILGAGGDSYVSDMAAGVAWSAGVYVPGAPVNMTPANVVNISAAFPAATCPQVFKDAITQAHSRNVPVVVAAGNSGANAASYAPANCLGAIVVGATAGQTWQSMTGYSNWGWPLDVLAPGGASGSDVWSTVTDGQTGPGNPSYGPLNGTSMAAPHVAGVIALMKERDPNISVESVRAILQNTGSTVNGYKFVDAKKAVAAVTPTIARAPFSDVAVNHPFRQEIAWARNVGITTAWADGTYRPEADISRAAMAAYLYRLAGSPTYAPSVRSPFKDLAPTDPFYKEISWLASKGISTGWADGTFRPNDSISREAMAAFIYRLAGSPAYSPSANSPFVDYGRGNAFYKEVSWLASKRITTGWNDGTCRPYEPVSRGAMAAFLYRFSQNS